MLNVFCAFFVMILGLLVNGDVFADNQTAPQTEHYFLTVADIHFDPFIGCEKSPRPCPLLMSLEKSPYQSWDMIFEKSGDQSVSAEYEDTNYPLLKSALQQLKFVDQEKHPDFVLVLGDFLAHKFDSKYMRFSKDHSKASYYAFIKKTMIYLTYKLRNTFPGIDIYPVIGNNDSYTGDYSVVPKGSFLIDTGNIWSSLILTKNNKESFRSTFSQAGYYTVTIPHQPQHKIIILNTVLFSVNAETKREMKAADEEFKWLHQKLAEAKAAHQQVILAFHIPASINMFGGIKTQFGAKEFWQPNYIHLFENELHEFSTNIISILPAHIHIEIKHRIILKEFADVPVDFTPSISPIFGNDPGFKIFTYDPNTLEIKTIQTYYYPLHRTSPDWHKEYGLLDQWQHERKQYS